MSCGVAAVVFLEQGAGNLFRFGHTLDGIEQRYRAHIESFRGRLPFAFVPALEDRPDLPRVADNDGVAVAYLRAAIPSGSRTCDDSSMMIQSSSVSSARLLRIEKQVDAITG